MRRGIVITIAILLILMPSTLLAAEYSGVGTVFELSPSIRGMGMGNAFTGMSSDGSIVFFNPANLAYLENAEIVGLSSKELHALKYFGIAYADKNFGFGVGNLSANFQVVGEFLNPIGEAAVSEIGVIGAYGFTLNNYISMGVAGKAYIDNGVGDKGTGCTLDIGLSLKQDVFTLGAVGKNLVGRVKYENGTEQRFERKYRIGLSAEVSEGVLFVADLSEDDVRLGAEYTLNKFSGRAGVIHSEGDTIYTLGFGLLSDGGLSIDYALMLHPIMPMSNRVGMRLRF